MSYYTRWDKTICEKLSHLNRLVQEEWIAPSEALATARQLDPTCYVCPKCGFIQACCDCTVELSIEQIQEAIRNER